MKFTVAIPTYDRNETLAANLAVLLPQLDDDVDLLIIDNASPTPVADTLTPLLARYPEARVEIRRNVANIGGNANIMRCFEYASGPWIWALGDDDGVDPSAVRTIRAAIDRHPDAACVNFYSESRYHPERNEEIVTTGVEAFLDATDGFGSILFMSNSVFRLEAVRPHLKAGYHYAYSCGPHLAMLLTALGTSGRSVFSTDSIIADVRTGTAREHLANGLTPVLGLATLLELPLPEPARLRLRELLVDAGRTWLSIPGLMSHLAPLAQHDGGEFARYLFRTGAQRFYRLDRSLGTRIKILAATVLLLNGRLALRVVGKRYEKTKGARLRVAESKDFTARA